MFTVGENWNYSRIAAYPTHRLDVILLFYYIVTGKVFLITGENYGGSSYEVKLEGVKE